MLPGVLLVKCGEGAAKAPFSGLRIDGQRVQDHDLVIRRVVLPRSARVNVRLKPVEDAGICASTPTRELKHYTLQMIIAVGFKVNNPRAV